MTASASTSGPASTSDPATSEPANPDPTTSDLATRPDRTVIRRGMTLLWRSVRTHPVPFSLSVVGATVFAVMTVASTAALGRVTDDVIVPALTGDRAGGTFGVVDGGTVLVVAGAVVIISLVRAAGVVARRYFCGMTTFRMGATWRGQLAERYLAAPLRFHTRRPAGELMAHADNDALKAIEFINPAPFSMSAFVIGAAAFARLLVVDWVLALVALAVFPTLLVANRLYTARVEHPAARGQARYGDMASVAHESFDGALVVKVLGLADHERDRFARSTDALRRERVQVGELRAWFEPGLTALPNLGSVAVLGLGAWRLSTGAVTEGGIVEALALFAVLATPMRVMGYLLQSLPPSVVAADRLDRVLAVDADERHPARGTTTLPEGPLSVEVAGLGFAHDPAVPVLDDVSFSVAPGEVVALTGATAGGKTSLCLCVAGLLEPTAGTVRLGGVDIVDLEPAALPDAVGFVFQETFLFADTVAANVLAGTDSEASRTAGVSRTPELGGTPEVSRTRQLSRTREANRAAEADAELGRALARARADGFVAALSAGLETELGERGVTLSGGQRQRLALARALVRRPRLLVLDDATSAVDATVEEQILTGLGRELETTTLVVAHRVSTIRLADRVVFLDGGRVAATGPHDELLATVPAYAALVRAYAEGRADGPGVASGNGPDPRSPGGPGALSGDGLGGPSDGPGGPGALSGDGLGGPSDGPGGPEPVTTGGSP